MSTTDVATVHGAARLRGELRLPGDKSVSHRALLFATLAAGESRIEGAGDGADVRSTAAIMRALGARIEREHERDGRVDYRVDLAAAPTACGNRTASWIAATPARVCDSSPGCLPACP